jgi:hypothetical protein
MPVTMPNLIGLGRGTAEAMLDGLLLRHIAQFPFSATGTGAASQQTPVSGTSVGQYSVVTVAYPSPLGPMPDSPIQGPNPPSGTYEGQINSVMIGNPWGSGEGAWVEFSTTIDGAAAAIMLALYFDDSANPPPQLSRTKWMNRGALLGIAQRAFTNGHNARIVTTSDLFAQSIEIYKR